MSFFIINKLCRIKKKRKTITENCFLKVPLDSNIALHTIMSCTYNIMNIKTTILLDAESEICSKSNYVA